MFEDRGVIGFDALGASTDLTVKVFADFSIYGDHPLKGVGLSGVEEINVVFVFDGGAATCAEKQKNKKPEHDALFPGNQMSGLTWSG